jgi:hypothetical protein
MADETTQIQVTHGPYAGQRLTVSKTDAQAAISEGWAVDAFKPADPNAEPAKELTEDERSKIIEKAEHAAKVLRGEKDQEGDESKKSEAPKRAATERDMKPGEAGEYETRSTPKPGTRK